MHLYVRVYMQVCFDGEIIHCGQCNEKMYEAGVLTVEAMHQRVQNNQMNTFSIPNVYFEH